MSCYLRDSPTIKESRGFRKWRSMYARDLQQFITAHPATFLRRLQKGCPQEFRWRAWVALFRWKLLDKTVPIVYDKRIDNSRPIAVYNTNVKAPEPVRDFCNNGNSLLPPLCPISLEEYITLSERQSEFWHIICIDTPRTYPEVPDFQEEGIKTILTRILNAIANYKPNLGYTQGMNFIVGLLLLVSDFHELETFAATIILLDLYNLRGFFHNGFPLTLYYVDLFEKIAKEELPRLTNHFSEKCFKPEVVLLPWIMTLFTQTLPLRTAVVVWDYLLAEGLHGVIFVTLSIFRVLQHYLIDFEFERIMEFLRSLRKTGDCDATEVGRMLVRHAAKQNIPNWAMDRLLSIDVNALIISSQSLRDNQKDQLSLFGSLPPATLPATPANETFGYSTSAAMLFGTALPKVLQEDEEEEEEEEEPWYDLGCS